VLAECDNKLKRNGIAMTTIRSSNNVERGIIELLEKHKMRK
jgi:hypothetical protein